MAKDASIAPKERINITYKPATGDAKEEKELPLKLLAVGDFTLREDDTPLEDRKPIDVNKENFNEVMKGQNLSLDISVPDRLSEKEGGEISASLRFESLKDFDPASIARQVPELNSLLELREALTALKGPLGNVPAFRKKIQELLKDEGARKKLFDELGLDASGGTEE